MTRPLRLFLLWHFHQPWYLDGSGRARLPWVRLHALKDYADLPDLLAEVPRVPHVANLVPGLLDQIEWAASGGRDAFLDVARAPVEEWGATEVAFALSNFFSANRERLIDPVSRYAELLRRKERGEPFETADLRDLVVHFHLAWCGARLGKEALVVRLRHRGRRFSAADLDALLDLQSSFLAGVVPSWRRAFASGTVEAATSPYHHPILPLLLDHGAAREAVPDLPLPAGGFRFRADAVSHVALGLDAFERHIGFRPSGMWPPEGSLSEAALALLGEAGVSWVVSDEDLLFNSLPGGRGTLGPGDHARRAFRPWRLAGPAPTPAIFFRDRVLSDRIGFSYATWKPEDAAADFVARLRSVRDAAPDADLVVPVALDGENAWETYPENGAPFLRALVRALAAEPWIDVTTPSRVLATREPESLPRLAAGSWVDGTFRTWIGDPVKNRAWEMLGSARRGLAPVVDGARDVPPLEVLAGRADGPQRARAALLAAEASDWFWWFGEGHSSSHDAVFDETFRAHVRDAWEAAGRAAPADLSVPLASTPAAEAPAGVRPLAPRLDGRRLDETEWIGAGRVAVSSSGAMARAAPLLKDALFGLGPDGSPLYLRLDPPAGSAARDLAGKTLRLDVAANGGPPATFDVPLVAGRSESVVWHLAVDQVAELSIAVLPRRAGETISFRLTLLDAAGRTLERIPAEGWVRFRALG